jgi:uncharacterized membrane protein YedE/YeeE
MQATDPTSAVLGGILMGTSGGMLLLAAGEIAGISGIMGALLQKQTAHRAWRLCFVVGLLLGGALWSQLSPAQPLMRQRPSTVLIAGLLVGVGTQLARGCTSGHGLCGLARLSARSCLATFIFMITGMLAVFCNKYAAALFP